MKAIAAPATSAAVENMAASVRRPTFRFIRVTPLFGRPRTRRRADCASSAGGGRLPGPVGWAAGTRASLLSQPGSAVAGGDHVGLYGVLRGVGRVAGHHCALVEGAGAEVRAAARLAAVTAAAEHDG